MQHEYMLKKRKRIEPDIKDPMFRLYIYHKRESVGIYTHVAIYKHFFKYSFRA